MEWRNLIKQYRFRYGLSQHDIGYLLGVSQKTVSRWESGENNPGPSQRRKFKDLLRNPSYILYNSLVHAVRNCPVHRSLVLQHNVELLAVSRAAAARRPSIVEWLGYELTPIASGALALMIEDRELRKAAAKGEILCVSAITKNTLKLPEFPPDLTYQITVSCLRIEGKVFCDAISALAPEGSKLGYRAVPLDGIAGS